MNTFRTLRSIAILLIILCIPVYGCKSADNGQQAAGNETRAAAPDGQGSVAWMEFDAALAKAKAENKYIFMDVYTDWCTYCKMLDQNTFPIPGVADRLNNDLVAVKLNAEGDVKKLTFEGRQMTERELARQMNVTSYPTMWIFTPEGKRLKYISGYKAPGELMDILDYVSTGGMARNEDYVEFLKTNKR